jgi:Domain of unknown function (DUF397)
VRPVGSCKSGVSPELPRIFAVPGERRIVGCLLGRTGIPQLQGNCVEISVHESFVLVRDSKNANGVVLEIPAGPWRELMRRIRNGELGCG